MKLVYVGLIVLVSAVIEIQSERTRSGVCKWCRWDEYARFKRAKYYSNPSSRFYNRGPMTYPIKGTYSYPPSSGYHMDDARKPHYYKPKVSNSRPINNVLGEEDMNYNIMDFVSKQDLDKIVGFGNENERVSPKYRGSNTDSLYETSNYISNRGDKYESKLYNDNALELDIYNDDLRPYSIEYNNANINELTEMNLFRFNELQPSALFINENDLMLKAQLDYNRHNNNQQVSSLNAYAHQIANENPRHANIYTYNSLTQEEQLPKPTNLREDDYEVSYTNKVPTVVKANSNSYKIENLGTLPLMNYHSKLETVDSYKVPHYTVTSPEKYRDQSSSVNIPVEPAPPVSTAREQSDAHLKAIKIWTHKSRGTAYTLHGDGTLSLEKPLRPQTYYDHP